jgi:hypothetical protein
MMGIVISQSLRADGSETRPFILWNQPVMVKAGFPKPATAERAKTGWCPFSRLSDIRAAGNSLVGSACRLSPCVAFRHCPRVLYKRNIMISLGNFPVLSPVGLGRQGV